MNPEIPEIRAAMKRQGYRLADAGRLLGLDSSQVSRTFAGARRLQLHEARKLREWLGLAEGSASGSVSLLPGMVPLYGWEGDALPLSDDTLIGAVPMHPGQANTREPFAVQIQDDRMVPRYEPGEIIYVAPNRWPTQLKYAVVQTEDGAHVGQLKRREADALVLQQLNPPRTLTLLTAEVIAVHTIVGAG